MRRLLPGATRALNLAADRALRELRSSPVGSLPATQAPRIGRPVATRSDTAGLAWKARNAARDWSEAADRLTWALLVFEAVLLGSAGLLTAGILIVAPGR